MEVHMAVRLTMIRLKEMIYYYRSSTRTVHHAHAYLDLRELRDLNYLILLAESVTQS